LDFCIELLNQRIQVEDYECALICALAVLGRGESGWRDTDSYPPILSKVVKIGRFMVVHKAMRLDPKACDMMRLLRDHQMAGDWMAESPMDDPEYIYSGSRPDGLASHDLSYENGQIRQSGHSGQNDQNSPNHVTDQAHIIQFSQAQRQHPQRSFREWLMILMAKFMVRGTYGPMQWILDLRTYRLKVHYNSTTPGHVGWMNQDQLLYKELNFSMGDFKGFIHGLVGATKQLLHEELLFATEGGSVPLIPWREIRDDPTQRGHGWSFLKDTRTQWPVEGSQWLMDRVRSEGGLQRRFTEAHAGRLRMGAIDSYLQRVVRFREKLAIAVHVSGGQPARAPELLSIRHYNTDSGGHRNIFVEDGLVVFVTQYHKGFFASNDTKVIHRYLPQEVGELVVWYLWLVLPFVERLEAYQQKIRGVESRNNN
jgi:hypothetical protein